MSAAGRHTVRLVGVPVPLWARIAAHQDAIYREFDIIRSGQPEQSLPNRLLSLVSDLRERFGTFSEANTQKLREAAERGEDSIDLEYEVPDAVGPAAARLRAMLDEVDAYCRQGEHLLTLATPPDLVAFREWFLLEFERQIGGGQPLPWDDFASEATEASPYPEGEDAENPVDHRLLYRVEGTPERPVVVVDGELDIATVGRLRETVQRLRNDGAQELTLDLERVGFIDSVGVSLLVTTFNRLNEEGKAFRVIVGPRVRTLLEISGLSSLLGAESAGSSDL